MEASAKSYTDCWNHFQKKDKETAKCKICSKQISCKASATTGLHRHLEHIHFMKRISKEIQISPKRMKTEYGFPPIESFFKANKPSIEEIVSKLATTDGMSIRQISTSEFIQNSVKALGYTLSRQPRDVMKLIYNYYDEIKAMVIFNIKKRQLNHEKVSLSIDEWTSLRNRRYLNIHVYYSDGNSDNLGLVRANGSCTSEILVDLVNQKLKNFELSFERDVVATTCDGANVMIKFGRLSPADYQLCYNHAIHLAVISVLYFKKTGDINDCDKDESNSENEFYSGTSDSDKEDSETIFDIEFVSEKCLSLTTNMDVSGTIKRVRSIVKLFKNSPVKNSVLQKHIKDGENNELTLILDCKTRWNSLYTMLTRVLRVIDAIEKSLNDLNLCHMWNIENTATAKCILNVLEPVKISIEALSRKNTNIISGEGILKFLFNTLQTENSSLSRQLITELKIQLLKRRNVPLSTLSKFLQNPTFERDPGDDFFKYSSKAEIVKVAKFYMTRLFSNHEDEENSSFKGGIYLEDASNEKNHMSLNDSTINLNKLLEQSIQDSIKEPQINIDDNFSSISKEINLYEITGNITPNLELLKKAISTLRPTSTQNERNFSTSGNFVTLKRTRLADRSIDCLCFLKHFFGNKLH